MIRFLRTWAGLRRAEQWEQEAEKYLNLLLTEKIRLKEVPERLLRSQYCFRMYITAFRVDRSVSRKQYEEDLIFLQMEIMLADLEHNEQLRNCLQRILDEMQSDLQYHPEMFQWK